ncbi:hypothetical protein PQX77_013237 [Marasmius sp. AFHP31]|nr:hypothetical protein PQX77_013237 [Marasmius sp. AFHP31]
MSLISPLYFALLQEKTRKLPGYTSSGLASKTLRVEDPQHLHNKWLRLHHAIWWNEAPTYDTHHSEYVLIQIVHNLEEDCTEIHVSKKVPVTQLHDQSPRKLQHPDLHLLLKALPIIENFPPPDSKNPTRAPTPAGRASTPVDVPERIRLINGHYYLWQGSSEVGSGVKVYWIYSGKTDKHRWAYFAKNNRTILLDEGVLDGSLPLTIPYDPRTIVEGDIINLTSTPENTPAGPSNMSATRTEMKIETKTETRKGKGRVAPGGDEPSRPGTPPGDPDGSDGEQGSDDGRGSDSWRSASVKEPPSFKERGRKPDVFTGKREEVDDFLMDFGRYLRLNEAIYPSASNKIDLFLSFIKHVWARHRSKEIEDDYANKAFADWRWKTWGDLRHRLREDFEPHDREGTAERKLDSIRQTGDLADIDEFNKVFNELAGDSEHNDAGLRLFYKQGINPALKATIDKFEVVPTTLDGWQKAAKKASTSAASTSGNWRQTTTQNVRATTASVPTANPTSNPPASTMPTTTDDAISVAARALAALTPEQHAALASLFSKKDF